MRREPTALSRTCMVNVLPALVWPYANTTPLKPLSALLTTGFTNAYTSSCLLVGPNTCTLGRRRARELMDAPERSVGSHSASDPKR
jgi:hypothetical protein